MGGSKETDLAALDAAAHVFDIGVSVPRLTGEFVFFVSMGLS